MSSSRFFRFSLYGLAVFILGASMYSLARPSGITGTLPEVTSEDHLEGAEQATITLVEYSDFQCPACKQVSPLLDRLEDAYANDIRLVYRHFPLSSIHANAQLAAQASEAAALQGKFWEMHDMLFDRQDDWERREDPTPLFITYAELLELDTEKFSQDLISDAVIARVQKDVSAGNTLGISATPTLFLNGEAVTFPRNTDPYTFLKETIDSKLTKE